MRLSIIIPAHNEESRIGPTLKEYLKFFKNLQKEKILEFELVVVINASTDDTQKTVSKYACNELRLLEFEKGGKGFALIEGFKDALLRENDLIGFVDADMSTPPNAFYDLVKGIEGADGADCTIASRWLKTSIVKTKQSIMRRITSRTFNFIVRTLFLMPYKDTQCGAKLFKKEALSVIISELGITKWAFDIDMLFRLRRHGYSIKEVPTIWEDKKDTKLNLLKVPIEMFSGVVRLRLINSPFKFAVTIYDSLPEFIKIHHEI